MPKDAVTRRRDRRPAGFCQEQTLVIIDTQTYSFRLQANWQASRPRGRGAGAVTKEGIDATLLQHVSSIE